MARRVCTMIAISLLLVAAACGTTDDKGKTATKDKTTTTSKPKTATTEKETVETVDPGDETSTTEAGGDEGDGSNPKFCEAASKLNTLFDDVEEDDYQGLVDAIKNSQDEFDAYISSAPDDLKDEAKVLVDAVKSLGSEIDKIKDDPDAKTKAEDAFKKISSPDLEAAGKATDEYETKTCGDSN